MPIKRDDLEGLLAAAGEIAAEKKASDKLQRQLSYLIKEAVRRYNSGEIANLKNFYKTLRNNEWVFNDFQQASKRNIPGEGIVEINETSMDGSHFERVRYAGINRYFHKHFDPKSDPELWRAEFGEAYVILTNGKNGSSSLMCYGNSHRDGLMRGTHPEDSKRGASHYFEVRGDEKQLQRAVDSFREDPKNIARFAKTVFRIGKHNFSRRQGRRISRESDVFAHLKTLYINDGKVTRHPVE